MSMKRIVLQLKKECIDEIGKTKNLLNLALYQEIYENADRIELKLKRIVSE